MVRKFAFAAFALAAVSTITPAAAFDGQPRPQQSASTFTNEDIVRSGHEFFGSTTAGLANVLSHALATFGLPDAYILGEEGGGALIGGVRYGEGALQHPSTYPIPVFWQGPSLGWDFGGSGSRVMMLVYNLPSTDRLMQRFTGVEGSAYLVGGVSMTVLAAHDTYIVPVRTGLGARLGVNIGYLKFTPEPTWNPF
ncbi:MAG: DUF1134 domain-containing protein [Pseudomonadota bacterium]